MMGPKKVRRPYSPKKRHLEAETEAKKRKAEDDDPQPKDKPSNPMMLTNIIVPVARMPKGLHKALLQAAPVYPWEAKTPIVGEPQDESAAASAEPAGTNKAVPAKAAGTPAGKNTAEPEEAAAKTQSESPKEDSPKDAPPLAGNGASEPADADAQSTRAAAAEPTAAPSTKATPEAAGSSEPDGRLAGKGKTPPQGAFSSPHTFIWAECPEDMRADAEKGTLMVYDVQQNRVITEKIQGSMEEAVNKKSWWLLPGPERSVYKTDRPEIYFTSRSRTGPHHCLTANLMHKFYFGKVHKIIKVQCSECDARRRYTLEVCDVVPANKDETIRDARNAMTPGAPKQVQQKQYMDYLQWTQESL